VRGGARAHGLRSGRLRALRLPAEPRSALAERAGGE
jgi:hypothetical protein